jgi:hypothetical protein
LYVKVKVRANLLWQVMYLPTALDKDATPQRKTHTTEQRANWQQQYKVQVKPQTHTKPKSAPLPHPPTRAQAPKRIVRRASAAKQHRHRRPALPVRTPLSRRGAPCRRRYASLGPTPCWQVSETPRAQDAAEREATTRSQLAVLESAGLRRVFLARWSCAQR